MEALKGGKLVENIPPDVQKLWDSAPIKRSPLQGAFQYLGTLKVLTQSLVE